MFKFPNFSLLKTRAWHCVIAINDQRLKKRGVRNKAKRTAETKEKREARLSKRR